MSPRHIRADADPCRTGLRLRASRDRLTPVAGRVRTRFAGGLRARTARIDGCAVRAVSADAVV